MARQRQGPVNTRTRFAAFSAAALGVLLPGLTDVASAARPDIRTLTCNEVQATIRRSGAVVMTTGENTYRRFAATARFCAPNEISRPTTVRAQDNQRCQVRYIGEQRDKLFDR